MTAFDGDGATTMMDRTARSLFTSGGGNSQNTDTDAIIGIAASVVLLSFVIAFCWLWYCLCCFGMTSSVTDDNERENSADVVESLPPNERKQYVLRALSIKTFSSTEFGSTITFTNDPASVLEESNNSDIPEQNCAICLDQFLDGDQIGVSCNEQCRHVFHKECLFAWLMKHNVCPCCRSVYIKPDEPASPL